MFGALMTFDFYVWDSRNMVQVFFSKGAAYCKSHFDVSPLYENVSVKGVSDGVEQRPDVQVVGSVLKDAPANLDVTLTEGAWSSALLGTKTALRVTTCPYQLPMLMVVKAGTLRFRNFVVVAILPWR